jgi:hypothetical protein
MCATHFIFTPQTQKDCCTSYGATSYTNSFHYNATICKNHHAENVKQDYISSYREPIDYITKNYDDPWNLTLSVKYYKNLISVALPVTSAAADTRLVFEVWYMPISTVNFTLVHVHLFMTLSNITLSVKKKEPGKRFSQHIFLWIYLRYWLNFKNEAESNYNAVTSW